MKSNINAFLLSIFKSMIIFCKIKRRKCRPKCLRGFVFYLLLFHLDSQIDMDFILDGGYIIPFRWYKQDGHES